MNDEVDVAYEAYMADIGGEHLANQREKESLNRKLLESAGLKLRHTTNYYDEPIDIWVDSSGWCFRTDQALAKLSAKSKE